MMDGLPSSRLDPVRREAEYIVSTSSNPERPTRDSPWLRLANFRKYIDLNRDAGPADRPAEY